MQCEFKSWFMGLRYNEINLVLIYIKLSNIITVTQLTMVCIISILKIKIICFAKLIILIISVIVIKIKYCINYIFLHIVYVEDTMIYDMFKLYI